MVAMLDLYRSHSFSFSCSCITFHKHPLIPSTNIQFSLPSFSLFYSRKLFSVVKFSETVRNDLKPSLINLGFRPTMRVLFHCSCSNSLANTHTEIGMLFSFFRELGLNEDETERILINHPDITSVSLESMRGRILSLQSLGVHSLDLCHLLTKRPTLLTAEEIDQWVGFMRDELDGQLEPIQLKRLLSATEPRFLVGFDKKVALLLNRGVPHEKIVHILNNVNLTKALCLKSVEEIDRTIAFLDPFGGVSLIVRRPNILNYDLNNQLIPRIGFLTELSGGDEEATGTVLRKLPAIVSYSVEHLEGHVELLRSFAGLDDAEIFRILLIFPNVISASKERKLRPRIEFLKQCSLNSSEIFKFLVKAPLFLAFSFEENIAYKLVFLVKIGYRYRTKDFAMAMGALTRTSCPNLQKVIGLFLNYGISCADIVAMSKKHPQILQYNHNSLEKKMEYLMEAMGRDVAEILAFPAFLGYKLDDRIKLRYEGKKNVRGEGMSLNKLLTVSTERFTDKNRRTDEVNSIDNLNMSECR